MITYTNHLRHLVHSDKYEENACAVTISTPDSKLIPPNNRALILFKAFSSKKNIAICSRLAMFQDSVYSQLNKIENIEIQLCNTLSSCASWDFMHEDPVQPSPLPSFASP